MTTLAPSDLRHRATAVSRVAGNAGIGIGGALGGLVAIYGLTGFVALFLVNAVTYLAYVCVLLAVVRDGPAAGRRARRVQAGCQGPALHPSRHHRRGDDRGRLGRVQLAVPPYARNELGIGTPLIGLLLLANAATVVVAQVPIARLAEGRRRVVMMALAASIFTGACLLVIAAAGASPRIAYAALTAASIAVGVGECFYTDRALAARRRPRAGGAARTVHGGDGPGLVGGPRDRAHAGRTAAESCASRGVPRCRRHGRGGLRVRADAGADAARSLPADASSGRRIREEGLAVVLLLGCGRASGSPGIL